MKGIGAFEVEERLEFVHTELFTVEAG